MNSLHLNSKMMNYAGYYEHELALRQPCYLISELSKLGFAYSWMFEAGFTWNDFELWISF